MTILLSDPAVASVPLDESGQALEPLDESFGVDRAVVRSGLAVRLRRAVDLLPPGIGLRVVEGLRTSSSQRAIIERYRAELRTEQPGLGVPELEVLVSRFVAPLEVAPHVAGAAVDLTLVDADGVDLDLGTPIDATPEQSAGRCFTDAPDIGAQAKVNRAMMGAALSGAGLVNYPTEWWHWSYGDRYWALMTGAPAAVYGPVDVTAAAA